MMDTLSIFPVKKLCLLAQCRNVEIRFIITRILIHMTPPLIDGRLSYIISRPATSPTEWCAVLTHPHPKMGGDKENNVVLALQRSLNSIGITTVRFDFRGVGQSQGWCTWRGIEERKDVEAVLKFTKSEVAGISKVALIAYSFGAAVGWSVSEMLARDGLIHACVAVGYPKGFWASFLFSQHYALVDPKAAIPKLFVIGDRDEFSSADGLRTFVEQNVSDPKQVVVVPGADHFVFNQEHLVTDPVVKFMMAVMQE